MAARLPLGAGYAARLGHEAVVELLLTRGAAVGLRSNNDQKNAIITLRPKKDTKLFVLHGFYPWKHFPWNKNI